MHKFSVRNLGLNHLTSFKPWVEIILLKYSLLDLEMRLSGGKLFRVNFLPEDRALKFMSWYIGVIEPSIRLSWAKLRQGWGMA